MPRISRLAAFLLLIACGNAAADPDSMKASVLSSVSDQGPVMVEMSDAVWAHAETAMGETESAELLARYAEVQGFTVERGVAGLATGFTASYGDGWPVIVIMGEYDALPRLSQDAVPTLSPLEHDAPGHGCGHNLFGVASLAAATAVKELIEAGELQGTLRYYGTPAEESVGGKIYMAREGLFDDVDLAIAWHPSHRTKVDVAGSQAMVETVVEFKGTTAHAAFDPWNGKSALDGLEIFTYALNLMREHVEPTVRIHYAYVDGGGAPNVVPATASAEVWIRDNEMASVIELMERAQVMVQGAAMAAGVEGEMRLIAGTYNTLINKEAAKVVYRNLEKLGPVPFTDEHQQFARELQTAMGVPAVGANGDAEPLDLDATEISGGSTDVADVSWVVPTIDFSVATAPVDIPWHSWGVVASSGSSIGHTGMKHAAQALAMSMVDFFSSPETLQAIRAEFEASTKDFTYHAYIPDGPPPEPQDK